VKIWKNIGMEIKDPLVRLRSEDPTKGTDVRGIGVETAQQHGIVGKFLSQNVIEQALFLRKEINLGETNPKCLGGSLSSSD